jgi:hypothetical protein
MQGVIRQVARLSCVTLASIVGGVLGFAGGFLVAFAIGKSAFELVSVYRPILEGQAQALCIFLLLIFSPLGCLLGLFIGGYYTKRLHFLVQNS